MVAARQYAPRQNMLRARGNLTYIQFIKLVKNLWAQAHPDIPIIPTGDDERAVYPSIMYGLELRKSHASDPKMRFREMVYDADKQPYLVSGQKFDNVVSFTAITEKEPELAEEVIEVFEDFMIEMTPIFKEMGVSEILYSRRYADSEESRAGEGVVKRKVAYLVRLEKIVSVKKETINNILIQARQDFVEAYEVESWTTHDPRYYYPLCYFGIHEDDLVDGLITVPRSYFRLGDRVYLQPAPPERFGEQGFPYNDIDPGFYHISGIVGSPYASDIKYEIKKSMDDLTHITFTHNATPIDEKGGVYYGQILYDDPRNVDIDVFDSYSHATPWS